MAELNKVFVNLRALTYKVFSDVSVGTHISTRALIIFVDLQAIVGGVYWRARHILANNEMQPRVEGTTTLFKTYTFEDFFDVQTSHDEEPVVRDMLNRLDESDVFWDVGAKIGLYGLLAAEHIGGGNVLIFEPSPTRALRAVENVKLNSYDVVVYCAALGLEPGYTQLASEENIPGVGSLALRVESGDQLIDAGEAPAPTLLKIDVEGAELDVLKGLKNALAATVGRVYCEIHPEKLTGLGSDEQEVYEVMERAGFDSERIETPRKTGPAYLVRFDKYV